MNTTSPKNAKIKKFSAREAALRIISAIIDAKISLSSLTSEQTGSTYYLKLDKKDQNLAKAIVLTSLKHHQEIDHLLKSYLKKQLPSGATKLKHLLHISIAQMLYMNVPSYAAINCAVEICKYDSRTKRFVNLVNAILRSIQRDYQNDAQKNLHLPALDTTQKWLSDMLIADYGKAKAAQIIEQFSQPTAINITTKKDIKKWVTQLGARQIWGNNLALPKSCKAEIERLEGYESGEWWVQDAGAYLPVYLLGDLTDKKVADLCAAPGGKTAQLICQNAAEIHAFEINTNRLTRLKENMQRLKLSAQYHLGAFQNSPLKNYFDVILLDAPCSSTGTIAKNTDIIWTKNQSEIEKLAELQYDMILTALDLLKEGGILLFSNCSIAKIEGEFVIERLIKEHHDKIELIKFNKSDSSLAEQELINNFITDAGFLRTLPGDLAHYIGQSEDFPLTIDGFFAAKLQKR